MNKIHNSSTLASLLHDPKPGEIVKVNTAYIEGWYPNRPAEVLRKAEIIGIHEYDKVPMISVKILEGPEQGRILTGLTRSALRKVE